MPTAVDLVTDLPADFEVFGQAVATSMADLLGGTTGQVLAKTTSTDMDFTWTTPQVGDITGVTAGTGISGGGTSGTVTVTNDMATTITTNGDLLYGTGSGTYTRRAIGSTGNVLTVAGGIPTWAAPAGGGKVLQVVFASTSTATTVASTTYTDSTLTATITPTLNTSKVLVIYDQKMQATRSAAACGGLVQLLRGVTSIQDLQQVLDANMGGATAGMAGSFGASYLDAPATTSATTYKTQVKTNTTANSGQVVAQASSTISTMTLLEIGA